MLGIKLGLGVNSIVRLHISELQALITSLFSSNEQGAIYIPKPIVNGEQALFQDSASTTPVTADGDPDGLMIDQSPNSNNAAQSTSAKRPLYNLENGIHSLKGDGVDDNIASQDTVPWLTGPGANAFFAIAFKANSTSVGYVVHCQGDQGGTSEHTLALLSYTGNSHRLNVGGSFFNFPATLDAVIVYCQFNKSTGTGVISWNGAEETPITVGNLSEIGHPIRLFSRETGAFFDGKIYGVVSVEGDVSFDNRRSVMNYLADLSGVTL